MEATLGTVAYIDGSALQHNIKQIKKLAPNSRILSIVKANAYGHGVEEVARSLSEFSDGFGVARIEEAIQLRGVGIEKPIVLLEGFYAESDLSSLAKYQLQTAIHCEEQLLALEAVTLSTPIQVWLKVDSGMHRLGVRPEQVEDFIKRLEDCGNVAKPIRFMSHFGYADDLSSPITPQQISTFSTAVLEGHETSLAASSGILAWPDSHFDWVRPGIILYGISPLSESSESLGFKPVMTLTSRLIAVREVKAGEKVGYGGNWTASQDTKVGVVATGYGDGYPRMAPNGTPVLVNGRLVPLAGRVSMDMLTVELGANAQDKVRDLVTLWGKGLPAETIAKHVDTIAYELVTRLTQRVVLSYQPTE